MDLKQIVEAVLFSSSDPLRISEIAKIADASIQDVENAVEELAREYAARNTAIEIIKIGDRYVMRVKPEYARFVERFVEREFDKATLRTLAVIAVKQPITLSKLAKIRGNKCYDHVKKLKELGFVRAEKKGRSTILTTTKEFAAYFGLEANDPKKIKEALRKYYETSDEMYNI